MPAPPSPPPKKQKRPAVEAVPLLPTSNGAMRGQYIESHQLTEGRFDEIESHNSFLEALNAWRGATPVKTTSKKGIETTPLKMTKPS